MDAVRTVVREEMSTVQRAVREEVSGAFRCAPPVAQSDATNPWLSTSEVAKRLGYRSSETVIKRISEGRLSASKLGGSKCWSVRESDLRRFEESNYPAQPPAPASVDEEANRLLQRLNRK